MLSAKLFKVFAQKLLDKVVRPLLTFKQTTCLSVVIAKIIKIFFVFYYYIYLCLNCTLETITESFSLY